MNIHFHSVDECKLIQLLKNQEQIMATQEQFAATLLRIQEAIGRLQTNAGGLNATQEDGLLTDMEAVASTLEVMAPAPTPPTEG